MAGKTQRFDQLPQITNGTSAENNIKFNDVFPMQHVDIPSQKNKMKKMTVSQMMCQPVVVCSTQQTGDGIYSATCINFPDFSLNYLDAEGNLNDLIGLVFKLKFEVPCNYGDVNAGTYPRLKINNSQSYPLLTQGLTMGVGAFVANQTFTCTIIPYNDSIAFDCDTNVRQVTNDYSIMTDGKTDYDNLEVPTDAILHYSFDEVPDLPDTEPYTKIENKHYTAYGSDVVPVERGHTFAFKAKTRNNGGENQNECILYFYQSDWGHSETWSFDNANGYGNQEKWISFTVPTDWTGYPLVQFYPNTNSSGTYDWDIEYFYLYDITTQSLVFSQPIIDNSYGGHNATNNGVLATKGVCGKGIKLFGTNDGNNHVVIPDVYNKLHSDFTFSIWVNPANESENVHDNIISSYEQFILRNGASWSNTLMMYIYTNDNGTVRENFFNMINLLDANKWTHILVTKSGTEVKLYINSELRYTGTCQGSILNHYANTDIYFESTQRPKSLDDFQIFDRALSELEIKALYLNKANTPKFVTSMYNNEEDWKDLTTGITYRKSFGTVHLNIYNSETFAAIGGEYTIIGTLPEGYRPKVDVDIPLSFLGGSNYGFVRVLTSGEISVYVNATTNYFSTCGSF